MSSLLNVLRSLVTSEHFVRRVVVSCWLLLDGKNLISLSHYGVATYHSRLGRLHSESKSGLFRAAPANILPALPNHCECAGSAPCAAPTAVAKLAFPSHDDVAAAVPVFDRACPED